MIVTNPFTPGTWTRQEIDNVSRGWWVLVATGILSTVAGGIVLVTDWTVGDLAVCVGVMTTAGAISGRGVLPYWDLTLALGIAETLFGFWLLARPGLTLVAAVLAIGLWSMVHGVVVIALSFEIKAMSTRADRLAGGVGRATSSRGFGTAAN